MNLILKSFLPILEKGQAIYFENDNATGAVMVRITCTTQAGQTLASANPVMKTMGDEGLLSTLNMLSNQASETKARIDSNVPMAPPTEPFPENSL